MNWLMNELAAIPLIIGGISLFFITMVISDTIGKTGDKVFKKHQR